MARLLARHDFPQGWVRQAVRSKLRGVTDWSTIASLATAGGTLVLAVATFASIRSANRSARISERSARTAERSLLAGQRPLLVNSRLQDPTLKIQFPEGKWLTVDGGRAAVELTDEVVYLAVSVRNVGSGLAVLHGWHLRVGLLTERTHPPLEEFTTQNLDIYVAPGDNGLWLSALRDAGNEALQRGPARSPLAGRAVHPAAKPNRSARCRRSTARGHLADRVFTAAGREPGYG